MSDALVNYIIQQVNAGYKVDQIESYLKSYGYDHKDVDNSMKIAIDMSARSYIGYIDNLVNTGYSLSHIRSSMVSQGYDYRIVDHALEHYHKNFFSRIKDTLGVSPESSQRKQEEDKIRQYAEQGLSYGLTLENIQSNLISQGYDLHLVHKVMNTYRQSHFHVPKQVVFIILALITTGTLGFFFLGDGMTFSSEGGLDMQEKLLDLKSQNSYPDKDITPGDDLYYNIEANQMGYDREFDIEFTYEILDGDDTVRRKRDTKAVVSNLGGSISLPSSLSPGEYEFKVTADYKGEVEATTGFDFVVMSEDEVDDDLNDSEEEPADESADVEDSQKDDEDDDPDFEIDPDDELEEPDDDKLDEEIPDVTDPDFDEDDFDISELSKTRLLLTSEKSRLSSLVEKNESEYAVFLCDKVEHENKRVECKNFVAQESGDENFCDEISSKSRKEMCYLSFAQDKTDSAHCEKFSTRQLNTLCRIYTIKNKNMELQDIDDEDEYRKKLKELYG
ncbi:MAG: hypothetical protein ACLFNK_03055 [Candidatus Woesearchaeota archaeon]